MECIGVNLLEHRFERGFLGSSGMRNFLEGVGIVYVGVIALDFFELFQWDILLKERYSGFLVGCVGHCGFVKGVTVCVGIEK